MEVIAYVIAVLISLFWVIICALKGKFWFAAIGVFIPIFAIVGAIRLAKPHSSWARNRYNDYKMGRARARFRA